MEGRRLQREQQNLFCDESEAAGAPRERRSCRAVPAESVRPGMEINPVYGEEHFLFFVT